MSRAAGWIGLVAGALAAVAALSRGAGGLLPVPWDTSAGLLLATLAAVTLRRNPLAQAGMSGLALLVLARYLPDYFRAPSVWPALVLILFTTLAFGLGTLGWMLDRYPVGTGHPK